MPAIGVGERQSGSVSADGPVGHGGENLRFALFTGQNPHVEVFLTSTLDGRVPGQRTKDFTLATILSRRNGVTIHVDIL